MAASSEARRSRMEEILSNGRVCLAKVWAERLKWGSERMVSKEIFVVPLLKFTGGEEGLMVLLHKVVPVLYPATHVRYRLPVGCSRPITSPKHCRTADVGWHRSTPNRCICSGVLGCIG